MKRMLLNIDQKAIAVRLSVHASHLDKEIHKKTDIRCEECLMKRQNLISIQTDGKRNEDSSSRQKRKKQKRQWTATPPQDAGSIHATVFGPSKSSISAADAGRNCHLPPGLQQSVFSLMGGGESWKPFFFRAQWNMSKSDETIVALSSSVMIAPFPQHWSLGRKALKNHSFSSVMLASFLHVCICVCCKCACGCLLAGPPHTECRLTGSVLACNSTARACECMLVRTPLVTLCGPIGEQTVQTSPVRFALLVYTLHSQRSAPPLSSLLPPLLSGSLKTQSSCGSSWSSNSKKRGKTHLWTRLTAVTAFPFTMKLHKL